jgi:hypothetical protein
MAHDNRRYHLEMILRELMKIRPLRETRCYLSLDDGERDLMIQIVSAELARHLSGACKDQ